MSSLLGGFGGGAIGKAVVNLDLDSGKYLAELKAAEATTRGSTSQLSQMFQGAGGTIAKVIGGWSVAVTAFAVSAVKAAQESEAVLAQLANATGGATAAFEEQASALQALTGFTDEAILSADTLLTRFDLTDDQIRSSIPVVLDYARATGKAVPDAAEAIGKALLGNTRALKTVGIEYEVTGNRAQDFTNILGLLQGKVGGAAAAFGDTFAGQTAKLSAAFDEMKETVGRELIPVLAELTPEITELVNKLSPVLATAFRTSVEEAEPFIEILTQLVDLIPDATMETGSFSGALDDMVGIINPTTAGLMDIVDITTEWTARTDDAEAAMKEASRVAAHDYVEGLRQSGVEAEGLAAAEEKVTAEADKMAAEFKDAKAAALDTFTTTADVWAKLAEQSRVTAEQIIRNLNRQIRAQENFAENFADVEARSVTPAAERMLAEIATLGDEGAVVLEELARVNDRKFNEIVKRWKESQKGLDANTDAVAEFTAGINGIPSNKSVTLSVNVIPNLSSGALAGWNPIIRDAILDELHRVNQT